MTYYSHVRTEIFHWIQGEQIRVLDLGCGAGNNGEEIRRLHKAHVTGVETNVEMAKLAAQKLDACICANLEDCDLEEKGLGEDQFDYILCLDILEHLKDPWGCLQYLTRFLRQGGKIIIAIPNVCNIKTIFEMLKGNWLLEESGIHDNTHLRWFGIQNILDMLEGAGLQAQEILRYRYFQFHLKKNVYDIDWGMLRLKHMDAETIENLETGHFFVLASKKVPCATENIPAPIIRDMGQIQRFNKGFHFERYRIRTNLWRSLCRGILTALGAGRSIPK